MPASAQPPYIDQVQARRPAAERVKRVLSSSTIAAGVMLAAALASLVLANSPAAGSFSHLWHTEVSVGVGSAVFALSLEEIVNDILMAVFFLLVGVEIKHEMVAGELRDPRRAALPVVAAFGGALVPMGIYLALNAGRPTMGGWGVPMATDIAFALGLLALLGSRVPASLKVFLSTLAVADDIIAILVIALFYGDTPDLLMLALAAACVVALVALGRAHVYSLAPYMALGCLLWVFVFMSGIHATIAGVLLAFTIPCRTKVDVGGYGSWASDAAQRAQESLDADAHVLSQGEFLEHALGASKVARHAAPPSVRLEHALSPWVNFLALPMFALANAGVSLGGVDFADPSSLAAVAGVAAGLVLGKPIGILLSTFALVRTGVAELPAGLRWSHMAGAGLLAGVGFTMAIFVANLAFADPAHVAAAKVGILAASTVAGVVGLLALSRTHKAEDARATARAAS